MSRNVAIPHRRRKRRDGREAGDDFRLHRRRRMRRRGRRAYIRSVYFLPSLATLGNAVCGFASIYIASLPSAESDPVAQFFFRYRFFAAAYLVFLAMVFDGLDGRLARFARHTTDFGGQLDSLADVISFGAAPAFLALQVFKAQAEGPSMPFMVSRLVWAIGALYFSCALLRLARFNVSNETGEQHHFSFLGLPSPGAGGAVVSFVLMQQDLQQYADASPGGVFSFLAGTLAFLLPLIVLATGLLMVSNVRYPHVINRYLRGRRSIGRLIFVLTLLLLLVVAHRYAIGIGTLLYVLMGVSNNAMLRYRLLRTKRPA